MGAGISGIGPLTSTLMIPMLTDGSRRDSQADLICLSSLSAKALSDRLPGCLRGGIARVARWCHGAGAR